ncbi:MAG: glycerol-3-phosphate dehydrogenase subunit C [Parasphingorhabdus sp.]|jgi:glycerol-3-phosphate dehydrogenase subunit C
MAHGTQREGSLEAPTRHALDWKSDAFYNEDELFTEMERVFDICHGCRRCVSLCQSFPTLFDLVDESETMEVDGIAKQDYWKVVDHCYLCDLCYLTKCPYVPPHEWNLDFPHLMLRAKATRFKEESSSTRDKILSSTDTVGSLASIPIVVNVVNAANNNTAARGLLEKTLGVHKDARLPPYNSKTLRKRMRGHSSVVAKAGQRTAGKVALFGTCYGNYNEPGIGEDLVTVLEHNNIEVKLIDGEKCCGMPKLELGDLQSVEKQKQHNIPLMKKAIDEGYDIMALVPSCVLMFKQELPLMFPDDGDVTAVQKGMFDPFEYLMLRHKDGLLNTSFTNSLGKVSYHVACHQRVQRIGNKTRDLLKLIPDTTVTAIERCSGHDGTYAVKKEFHAASVKIARPVVKLIKRQDADHYGSDCPVAGRHLEHILDNGTTAQHPISLLRKAYGI